MFFKTYAFDEEWNSKYNTAMSGDKYSAVWVSHSSMGDFLKCPRAYFLKNVYKNPKTRRKMAVVNPALSLGQAVHEAVEGLGKLKTEDRFKVPLADAFEKAWEKVSGKRGGFLSAKEENNTKERGRQMIDRVERNPGPLLRKTVRLKEGHNGMPPNYFLSESEEIILCGKIDWLEYVPEDDSIKVIDFKTGRNEEKDDSLQLPIYLLLLKKLQKRKVSGGAYWYLDSSDELSPVVLPSEEESFEKVIKVARAVREARLSEKYSCPRGESGCFFCRPFEAVLRGEAELVGAGEYSQDLFVLGKNSED